MLYVSLCAAIALVSFITFILYGLDKYKAKRGLYRIPEKVLLGFSFFGGAIGGILGMALFRHKTRREHWYFRAVNALGILWPVALFVLLLNFF